MKRWSTEDFEGGKPILYDTIMVDTYPYMFVENQSL